MSAYSATLVLPRTISRPRARKDPEEQALLGSAQTGDELAFQHIVERYKKRVFTVIRSILSSSNDVEDVAQEAFTNIYFSLPAFDYRCSLGTWIYRITVNECFDYLRKRKVRKLVYESDMSEDEARRVENSEPTVDRQVPTDTTLARRDYLVKLLGRVSEEERMLLTMKEVEGFSVEELAARTGMNENTIKVKLFRARQKLVKAAQRLDRAPGLVAG